MALQRRNALTVVAAALVLIGVHAQSRADITSVTEMNLGGDAAAIIENGAFDEDSLTFSDRTHQHNGAAFDDGGVLSTAGGNIVGLPAYLLGGDYVRFANNARDQDDYSAVVTTDTASVFYLLVDNRVNGPSGDTSSPNSTDPDLGGTLQWVLDEGFIRVNTGISPNGQADYTGVDEGGDGVGPGQGLNQFYAVYRSPVPGTSASVRNNGVGGSNMIALVAIPVDVPAVPAVSTWGLVALIGMLVCVGAVLLRRRSLASATA